MPAILKNKKFLKILAITVCVLLALGIAVGAAVLGINMAVIGSVKDNILSEEQAAQLQDVDCIIVLGCQVKSDGTPSHMLEDRLKRGVALYEAGAAPKILMSGDHGTKDYDEVNAMKKYAMDAGLPTADVFMDHAGFSTYESMYRAKEVFKAEKIVIVTQGYHLPRAIKCAEALGLEAYGVHSDLRNYGKDLYNNTREFLARVKDFFYCIIKPEPTYLGEAILISGNGDATNDK